MPPWQRLLHQEGQGTKEAIEHLDAEALALLARLTAGEALHLAELEQLLEAFPGDEERREPVSTHLEDAWDEWHTLLLALALLGAEWVLRKRVELV